MVFHMLRWEVGEDSFHSILKGATHPVRRQADPHGRFHQGCRIQLAAAAYCVLRAVDRRHRCACVQQQIHRLPARQQQRLSDHREIGQDLDLFSMPVELKIETDGKTEIKRIDVVGNRFTICRGHLRAPAPYLARPQQLGAEEYSRHAGAHRDPSRPAVDRARETPRRQSRNIRRR